MPDETKKKKSVWQVIREGLVSIGALAEATKPKKKKKVRELGRTQPAGRPVTPQPSPEQQEYLDRQKEKK